MLCKFNYFESFYSMLLTNFKSKSSKKLLLLTIKYFYNKNIFYNTYKFMTYKKRILLTARNKVPFNLIYYFLTVDFNYSFKNYFKIFMNKLMASGKRFIIEKVLNNLFISSKSIVFFNYLYAAIEYLKPHINIKIFSFKRRGKQRSVKKGKKVKKQVKIIPEKIGPLKSYKMAFKWLISSILESNLDRSSSILNEVYNVCFYKTGPSILRKKMLYKAASKNRSSFHFRWNKGSKVF